MFDLVAVVGDNNTKAIVLQCRCCRCRWLLLLLLLVVVVVVVAIRMAAVLSESP